MWVRGEGEGGLSWLVARVHLWGWLAGGQASVRMRVCGGWWWWGGVRGHHCTGRAAAASASLAPRCRAYMHHHHHQPQTQTLLLLPRFHLLPARGHTQPAPTPAAPQPARRNGAAATHPPTHPPIPTQTPTRTHLLPEANRVNGGVLGGAEPQAAACGGDMRAVPVPAARGASAWGKWCGCGGGGGSGAWGGRYECARVRM